MNSIEPQVNREFPYFTSALLSDLGLPHGFSLRYRLKPNGNRVRANLGFSSELGPGEALADRKRFCRALGLDPGKLTAGYQSHTDRVAVVDGVDVGRGGMDLSTALPDTDGLVTGVAGAALGVFTADCVPILLADPDRKCVGAVHSGWKGTAGRIAANAVDMMRTALSCKPENIRAAIGPSISMAAYEVGEEVIRAFRSIIPEGDGVVFKPSGGGKWLLDLWEANRILLVKSGLRPDHIQVLGLCTATNPDLFYSNRRDRGILGSLGAFIGCAFLQSQ